jgi:hypothetical protein
MFLEISCFKILKQHFMNQNLFVFLITILLISIYSCDQVTKNRSNGSSEQTTASKELKPQTGNYPIISDSSDCDYFVKRDEADLMEKKFKSVFYKELPIKEFWIEACVVKAIHKFLEENQTYDGVRFFLGANRSGLFQPKPVLLVTPTTKASASSSVEQHNNQFGVPIELENVCKSETLLVNESYGSAFEKINLFGKKFRKELVEGQRNPAGMDPLSLGIWMSKCKIRSLIKLYTPENNLDGLMAIAAAYYKDDARREQGERKYVVQSTFIFVPTRNKERYWEIVPPIPSNWQPKNGGVNHGSLCPNVCN